MPESTLSALSLTLPKDLPSNALFALAGAILTVLFLSRHTSPKATGIYELPGPSILTAWRFFTKRFEFMQTQFKRTGRSWIQFQVSQFRVIAVSGEEGRKFFFENKSFDLEEGYDVLNGGTPVLDDESVKAHRVHFTSWFNKHVVSLLRKERLSDAVPLLLDDVYRRVSFWSWSDSRVPLENIYDLVFQMTVRMSTCTEIAESKDTVATLSKLYRDLENSASPLSLLLPSWFPNAAAAQNLKKKATKELCDTLSRYVDVRREADVPRSSDAMDYLIAQGSSNQEIVDFVLNFLFGGVINTGMTACWMLLYLSAHPTWKARAKSEIAALILNHTDTTLTTTTNNNNNSSFASFHDRLSIIPISAWEQELPVIDAIIHETLRLTQTGTALRRNVSQDIDISSVHGKQKGHVVLPKGSFLAYWMGEVHLDPRIYDDPFSFDPERYLGSGSGRGGQKVGGVHYPFLGWGVGRHTCTGQKIAKLELKILLAYFLATPESDFELCDFGGKFPEPFPEPDRNNLQQARPLGGPYYLQFRGLRQVGGTAND